jgi:eco47II restriction endonuclease
MGYNLGFITDDEIFAHVKNTVLEYRRDIDLKDFNKNLIDPIKMTFDTKIYGQSLEETIIAECIRQVDKTNNNRIGYFHQNLFRYAGRGWVVPANGKKGGFDIINEDRHLFIEMKNKHNTLNSSSATALYLKMQNKILKDDRATCYLVEIIAPNSQDITWTITINKEQFSHERIRRISVDRFYELVFDDKFAFCKLCKALPTILDDIIASDHTIALHNTVLEELNASINQLAPSSLYKQLYLLAFHAYAGFDHF